MFYKAIFRIRSVKQIEMPATPFVVHKVRKSLQPSRDQLSGHPLWMVVNCSTMFEFVPVSDPSSEHIDHIATSPCETCLAIVDKEFNTEPNFRRLDLEILGISLHPFMLLHFDFGGLDLGVLQAGLYVYDMKISKVRVSKVLSGERCTFANIRKHFRKLCKDSEPGVTDFCCTS